MNMCLGLVIWLVNTGHLYISKLTSTVKEIYLLLTVKPEIAIGSSGQIFLTNMFEIVDNTQLWHYDDNCLFKTPTTQYKRSPLLSCEFNSNGETVTMDEFLETTKFAQANVPFPVLMAAFTLYSKKLYPWENAEFNVYTRNGDSVQFIGNKMAYVDDIKSVEANIIADAE